MGEDGWMAVEPTLDEQYFPNGVEGSLVEREGDELFRTRKVYSCDMCCALVTGRDRERHAMWHEDRRA